jgi:spore coat polysaccharide biosynthesis predicted glycosyltransferase SpsG
MNKELRELAMSVLTKEAYQDFAAEMFAMSKSAALNIAKNNLEDVQSIVLETVYEASCDFVIFDHYRRSKDLYELVKSSEL